MIKNFLFICLGNVCIEQKIKANKGNSGFRLPSISKRKDRKKGQQILIELALSSDDRLSAKKSKTYTTTSLRDEENRCAD